MGMYSFEIVTVPNLASIFEYDISILAVAGSSITTEEVLQFTLNDTFTNVIVTAPEGTNVSYAENVVTWAIGSLDITTKDIPLVLKISAEHPTELEEGTLIASAITNTFVNEKGEEVTEAYEDFSFGPAPTKPSFKLEIIVTPLENCDYKLDFNVTNTSNATINNILINYQLNTADFIWITPPTSTTQWNVGTLNSGQSKTQTATIQFIGTTTGLKTVFADINASPEKDFIGIDSLEIAVMKTCPKIPCCEKCPKEIEVDFIECEQSKNITITPKIESDGREIKVKVTIDAACPKKRVVVGLELFEKQEDNSLVRLALKVLDLAPITGTRCDKRECDCATFFIPSALCSPRKFVIKAQAHYFSIDEVPCRCNCPTP